MEKIQIVGSNATFDLDEVRDNVILLSGRYFWRDDSERIVKVEGRFYRKASPLIVRTSTKGVTYALKKDCIQTDDGLWLVRDHPDTVEIDGKFIRRQYCIDINGKFYLKTDTRLQRLDTGRYCLKEDAVQLAPKHYNNLFVKRTDVTEGRVVNTVDGYIYSGDSQTIVEADGTRNVIHFSAIRGNDARNYTAVFNKFHNQGNPDPNRIVYAQAKTSDIQANFSIIEEYGIRVHNNEIQAIREQIELYVERNLREKIEQVRAAMNKSYSEAGDDENQARVISLNYHRYPGNQKLFVPDSTSLNVSKTCVKTGGKKYTFGVEIETSAGLLGDPICNQLGLTKVGDGSIGSAEYVTPPLHGDNGMDSLKAISDQLAKSTMVDDRCALHIHVGGADNSNVDTPSFNRDFLINAIKLGVQVEEELYKISPKTRAPEYKHCHSILRYKDVDKENWKDIIGTYVFGPQENWDNNIRMSDYRYGDEGRTKDTVLGPYNGGRYKWLNIVNIVSRANIKTIEFRMFAGTTSYDKIKNYVLICLAFVWFVENKAGNILKGGVTLKDVIESAYVDSPEIVTQLLEFVESRKTRFNRARVYSRKPF